MVQTEIISSAQGGGKTRKQWKIDASLAQRILLPLTLSVLISVNAW